MVDTSEWASCIRKSTALESVEQVVKTRRYIQIVLKWKSCESRMIFVVALLCQHLDLDFR